MRTVAILAVLLGGGTALAGLGIEVRVKKTDLAHEEEVEFVVSLVNRGEEEVRYLEPLFAGANTFPGVRFVQEGSGRVREFVPYDPPFQSMVRRGLQGAVIALKPGERKDYSYRRASFLLVDPATRKARWHEPTELPPGEYRLRAVYEKKDDRASFNVGGFDTEERSVPGIFTGRVEANPVVLRVGKATRPRVRITSFGKSDTTDVFAVFTNPTGREHVFTGEPRLELGSKMYGSFWAKPELDTRKTVALDLAALTWHRKGRALGLREAVPSGLCTLRLALRDGEKTVAASNSMWIRIPPVPNTFPEGVRVNASLSRGEIAAGESVTLEIEVWNGSKEHLRVVHRLSFPRECLVRIEDATGARRAIGSVTSKGTGSHNDLRPRGENVCRLAKGLSWDGEKFDPAPGLTRKDVVAIEPGSGIARDLDLGSHLSGGLTPGRYLVYAGYRNLEPGLRLGFERERQVPTGILWSEPVELLVR